MLKRKNRVSGKQRERELSIAREKKRKEVIRESAELVATLKELGWYEDSPHFSEESFIDRKMQEWERGQWKFPSGKFQDQKKIHSEYQQHFAKYIQECCPNVFEELRILVPLFIQVFGNNKDTFHHIFNQYKTEFLFDLQLQLENTVNHSIIKKWFLQFKTMGIGLDEFRFDYRLGEYRGVLLFLRLLFSSKGADENSTKDVEEAVRYLEEKLVFEAYDNLPDNFDWSVVPLLKSSEANAAVTEFMANENERSYLVSGAQSKLTEFLKELSDSETTEISAFLELQLTLLGWARKHNLEKDWLVRYAYYFLAQFNENPEIQIEEVQIPALAVWSLIGQTFEFKFNGWLAGVESREKYEDRLIQDFEEALKIYFHNTASFLNLDNKKRETSPRKYDRVKWLVRWTVQNWTIEQIIFEIDGDDENSIPDKFTDPNTVRKALRQFKEFDLPVRS